MSRLEKLSETDGIKAIINGYKEKGKALGKKEVAKEMLKEGFNPTLITKLTGLDSSEIEELMDIPISHEETGERLAKEEVAIKMLKEGFDLKLIAKVTQVKIDKVEIMKKQL